MKERERDKERKKKEREKSTRELNIKGNKIRNAERNHKSSRAAIFGGFLSCEGFRIEKSESSLLDLIKPFFKGSFGLLLFLLQV
jgi:hypothetical protein